MLTNHFPRASYFANQTLPFFYFLPFTLFPPPPPPPSTPSSSSSYILLHRISSFQKLMQINYQNYFTVNIFILMSSFRALNINFVKNGFYHLFLSCQYKRSPSADSLKLQITIVVRINFIVHICQLLERSYCHIYSRQLRAYLQITVYRQRNKIGTKNRLKIQRKLQKPYRVTPTCSLVFASVPISTIVYPSGDCVLP